MTAAETNITLPTIDQIFMASQRAMLAALDTTLLLAARTLQAEHADQLADVNTVEPKPPHLALTQSILIMISTLRELIASYCAIIDNMLGDA
jgi:Mg2+ and Co2+ transporter CorA